MWRFLLFVLAVFGSAAFYVYMRLRPLFPNLYTWRGWIVCATFLGIIFSYFVGSILQRHGALIIARPFVIIGSWAMAALLYCFIIFLFFDIIRLFNLLFIKADFLTFRYTFGNEKARIFSICGIATVALVCIIGYINAKFPIRKEITLKTEIQLTQPLRFILVSDVHLGMINSDKFFNRLAKRVNNENADFLLIAGDFFDGDPEPVFQSNTAEILKTINTKYGIFAIPGNHEYIGNADAALQFMRNNGVVVLRDSVANLPCGVSIIGRDDLSAIRAKGGRATLENLVSQADSNSYKIMLDHQPFHLEEAENAGVDLQLSGHTHHGQLWPLNYITSAIYECSFGQHKRGNTNYYVTSGYGTWGPPIRTTCHPEMIVFEIRQ